MDTEMQTETPPTMTTYRRRRTGSKLGRFSQEHIFNLVRTQGLACASDLGVTRSGLRQYLRRRGTSYSEVMGESRRRRRAKLQSTNSLRRDMLKKAMVRAQDLASSLGAKFFVDSSGQLHAKLVVEEVI